MLHVSGNFFFFGFFSSKLKQQQQQQKFSASKITLNRNSAGEFLPHFFMALKVMFRHL